MGYPHGEDSFQDAMRERMGLFLKDHCLDDVTELSATIFCTPSLQAVRLGITLYFPPSFSLELDHVPDIVYAEVDSGEEAERNIGEPTDVPATTGTLSPPARERAIKHICAFVCSLEKRGVHIKAINWGRGLTDLGLPGKPKDDVERRIKEVDPKALRMGSKTASNHLDVLRREQREKEEEKEKVKKVRRGKRDKGKKATTEGKGGDGGGTAAEAKCREELVKAFKKAMPGFDGGGHPLGGEYERDMQELMENFLQQKGDFSTEE